MEQAGVELEPVESADIVFLVHAGTLDFDTHCRAELKKYKIDPYTARRGKRPYVITGGAIGTVPFLALKYADAVAIGEAYNFVRMLLVKVKRGIDLKALVEWVVAYPYALDASQIKSLSVDPDRPWLLTSAAPTLAEPDTYIDWDGPPPIKPDDKVVRLMVSKGCPNKCLFCSTSWQQTYQYRPDPTLLLKQSQELKKRGERILYVSNDASAVPWYNRIDTRIDSGSMTVRQLLDPQHREWLQHNKIGRVRFGVEGMSTRIRRFLGKPVATAELSELITDLMNNRRVGTHLFYIAGLPFETWDDWTEFKGFFFDLVRAVTLMVCRIKVTSFCPTPPAPLARFGPAANYYENMRAVYGWLCANAVSRHFMVVWGMKPESLASMNAPVWNCDKRRALAIIKAGNYDFYPTPELAGRATSEIVRWPTPAELRWRVAETYRRRMDGQG
jgi:hypothetical protein